MKKGVNSVLKAGMLVGAFALTASLAACDGGGGEEGDAGDGDGDADAGCSSCSSCSSDGGAE